MNTIDKMKYITPVLRVIAVKVPPLLVASGNDDEEMDFGDPVDSYDAKRFNAHAWAEEEDLIDSEW